MKQAATKSAVTGLPRELASIGNSEQTSLKRCSRCETSERVKVQFVSEDRWYHEQSRPIKWGEFFIYKQQPKN